MTRLQRDTAVCGCVALFSLAMLIWVIPTQTPPYPGYGASPALVPSVAVGAMLVMALLGLVRNVALMRLGAAAGAEETDYPADGEASGAAAQVGRARLLHLVKIMLPCALLIPALGWVGFIPTSIAFLLVVQYIVGRREVVPAVVLAVAATLVMYVVMRYGFSVPIPGT